MTKYQEDSHDKNNIMKTWLILTDIISYGEEIAK